MRRFMIPDWAWGPIGVAQIWIGIVQVRQGGILDLLHGAALLLMGTLIIVMCVSIYRSDRRFERLTRELSQAADREPAAPDAGG